MFLVAIILDLKGSMKVGGEGHPHKLWPTVEGAGLYTEHGRQSVDDRFQEHQKPPLLYLEFQPGTVGKHCSIREHPCTRRLQPDVLPNLRLDVPGLPIQKPRYLDVSWTAKTRHLNSTSASSLLFFPQDSLRISLIVTV
jgi:hypothetical protein